MKCPLVISFTTFLHHLTYLFFSSCRTPKGYSKIEFERAVDWLVPPLYNFVLSEINDIWKYSCTKSFQKYRGTGGSIRWTGTTIKQIFSLEAVFCSQWWKVCFSSVAKPDLWWFRKFWSLEQRAVITSEEKKLNKIYFSTRMYRSQRIIMSPLKLVEDLPVQCLFRRNVLGTFRI